MESYSFISLHNSLLFSEHFYGWSLIINDSNPEVEKALLISIISMILMIHMILISTTSPIMIEMKRLNSYSSSDSYSFPFFYISFI
jgi:hypothetical protein